MKKKRANGGGRARYETGTSGRDQRETPDHGRLPEHPAAPRESMNLMPPRDPAFHTPETLVMKGSPVRVRASASRNAQHIGAFCVGEVRPGLWKCPESVPAKASAVPMQSRTSSRSTDTSSASASRSGTRSTACPTGVRCRSESAPRGPGAAARRRATSPSAWPRTGSAMCSTALDGGRFRVSFAQASPLARRPRSGCGTSRRSGAYISRRLSPAVGVATAAHLRCAADRVDHDDDRTMARRRRALLEHD